MAIAELIMKNRSYRRFVESERISAEQIGRWIGLARYSASGRNMQPLKYAVSTSPEVNAAIFPHLAWAGYLADWKGPAEGERPAAYIAVLHDTSLSDKYYCDDGIAIQSILLGAVEEGYGGCILGSVNRREIARILKLPRICLSCGSWPWENLRKPFSSTTWKATTSATGATPKGTTMSQKEKRRS